ncbi:hypothetical protein MMC18_001484 [Xylographa bjoerkii]|nr:hypothetical protein [Xylographa bjoerkii]
MTDFPICGVLGDYNTNFLGFDYASSPDGPDACITDCIGNSSCKAVGFGTPARFCLFLSDYLQKDEFQQTNLSQYYFWDNVCLDSSTSVTMASTIGYTTTSATYSTTTPIIPRYVSGYPICGVSGYISKSDNPALVLGTVSGFSQTHCIGSCRDNPSCRAISFESETNSCTLYSKEIQLLDLTSDTESSLEFYDEVCGEMIASTSTFTVTITTTPPTATSESPQISYATGYPLCEIPGYSYQQPVLDYAGSATRSECLQGCRANDTCHAVAYKDTSGDSCYFYRRHVEYDQVWEDKNSLWCFYDEVCQSDSFLSILSMYLSIFFGPFLLALTSASPAHTTSTSTTSVYPYVTAFPVCGTPGYTAEPGDHYNDVYPPAPVSKDDCVKACRRNATCKAVSYAGIYNLCSFYRLYMMEDQLEEDATSDFAHYDDFCSL